MPARSCPRARPRSDFRRARRANKRPAESTSFSIRKWNGQRLRSGDVERAARELGIKRRRVFELLRLAQSGCGIEAFLPMRVATRAKRLDKAVEAIIAQAIQQHYAGIARARPNRATAV